MSIVKKANKRYKEIFIAHDPVSQMDEAANKISQNNMIIAGKPHPVYLKPYFISVDQRQMFEEATKAILSAIEKVGDAFFSESRIRRLIKVKGRLADFLNTDPGYPDRQPVVRLDAFFLPETGTLKIIEFNCDVPAGMGDNEKLTDIFTELPSIRALQNDFDIHTNRLLDHHLKLLKKKYRQFCLSKGNTPSDNPLIVIVCKRDGHIRYEVNNIVDIYQKKGVFAKYADHRDFTYNGKELFLGDACVDVVYRNSSDQFFREESKGQVKKLILKITRAMCVKSTLFDNLLRETRLGHNEHVLRAVRDGNVCFVNPFSAHIGHSKAVLAIMYDERFHYLFDEEERHAIKKYIPWTQILCEKRTEFHGEEIALIDFIKKNKDFFVLKPTDDYGGHGVAIGIETDSHEWRKIVNKAWVSSDDYIVQELIPIPHEEFPVHEGEIFKGFEPKKVNINLWAFDGAYGGAYVRASDRSIINVSRGGGVVPVFDIKEK